MSEEQKQAVGYVSDREIAEAQKKYLAKYISGKGRDFIYLILLNDGKKWAFENKKDAVDLLKKKLHMTKVKNKEDHWEVKGYETKAELITLFLN